MRTWVWTKTGTNTGGVPSRALTGRSWRSQQPVLTITVSRPSARLSVDMAGGMGVAGDEHCDLQGCDGPCHRRRPILLQELADRDIFAVALGTGRRAGEQRELGGGRLP